MDRILNTLKCANCNEVLESPVILPCNHTICEKHVSNQTKEVMKCGKCGVEHRIPSNGFQPNLALQEQIEIGITNLDFGSVHTEAKKSCGSFGEFLNEIEAILRDPFVIAYERINELRNSVQLKGEELKVRIDQEMKKLIDRLDEYERQSKKNLSSYEIEAESTKLETELKLAHSNLNSWLASLKELKFDHKQWEKIIEESRKELKYINNELDIFKSKLLLNKFNENQSYVNWFKSIKIDAILEYVSVYKVSKIINESLAHKFEELLRKRNLNGRKWSLLYQGSRDGLKTSNFHSHCDGKPKTLTIVKSSNGNIFGGFTTIPWESIEYDGEDGYKYDKSAFLFSLVNKEKRTLIFEHTNETEKIKEAHARGSVWASFEYGPIFGSGHDLYIADKSNTNDDSYSNLGFTNTHPDYPKVSDRANSILAGSQFFEVDEIEVFQLEE